MHKLTVKDLMPGMVLEEEVYNKNGAVVIPKGTKLTPKKIELLKTWGVVYIKNNKVPRMDFDNKKELKESYNKSKEKITSFMEELKDSEMLEGEDIAEIEKISDEMLTYTLSSKSYAGLINEMKSKDSYTFQHSINVSIYASLMGKWMGYDFEAIRLLSMAAILHDIGKMKVPEEILNKPGELTAEEFEEVKKHPEYGYNMIFYSPSLGKDVALGVLQHHERNDGNGYPLGLKEDRITEFAKIIAVADIFDAITSTRIYADRFSPFDALKEIRSGAFKDLDPKISLMFFDNIISYFVGSDVILNTGEKGEIVYFNKEDLYNPVVRTESEIIDLSKDDARELKDVLIF